MNNRDYEAWEERMEEELREQNPQNQTAEEPDEKEPWQVTILSYMHDLVYLLSIVILLMMLCFRIVTVSGTSMNKTLYDGDSLLLLANTFYKNPQYGDIVVASKDTYDEGKAIIKRVIATEGQWVDIDFERGVVRISDDGMQTWHELDEPYVNTPTNLQEGMQFPVYVEEGCLFLMGDNRNGSLDSRSPDIGLVDKREVLGKVLLRVFPGTNGTDALGQPKEERDFGRVGVVD